MLKAYLSTLILVVSISLTAQIEKFAEMEWGKIPVTDLQMKVYPEDSTAQAVVLGIEGRMNVTSGNTSYEYSLVKHRRVKILDEAAIDEYSDVTLYYYHEKGAEHIRNIRAQSISPNGSKSEVSSKEIYREKINEWWTKVTFAFTNVEVGSVLEYRYQLNSDRVFAPEEWTFREEIPVRSSYFKFKNNVPLIFTYFISGAEYMYFENIAEGYDHLALGDMDIWMKGTEFLMENAVALTEEPYMTTLEDHKITIHLQYHGGASTYGSYEKTEKEAWDNASDDLLQSERIGLQYLRKARSNGVIATCENHVDENAEPVEKLFQIAQFVSKNIAWNGDEGIYAPLSPNRAFQTHEANIASIQYTGLALLHHYGFEAYPILLSTRDNGAMITEYPILDQFNYVVLIVFLDGKLKLVDMTDPLLSPGLLRVQALNKEGFMLKKDGSGWIDIGLPVFQDVHAYKAEIRADASVGVEMKNTMQAYSARSDRARMKTEELKNIWLERLPEGTQITEAIQKEAVDVREILVTTLKFDVPDAGFSSDERIYFSPILYSEFDENPFKLEDRSFPIDFPYPFEEKSVYSYSIPEGYVVEALPERVDMRLPNLDAVFQYIAQERGGKVQIMMILRVKKTKFSPSEYSALRDLFESAVEKIGEQIVLKKNN